MTEKYINKKVKERQNWGQQYENHPKLRPTRPQSAWNNEYILYRNYVYDKYSVLSPVPEVLLFLRLNGFFRVMNETL